MAGPAGVDVLHKLFLRTPNSNYLSFFSKGNFVLDRIVLVVRYRNLRQIADAFGVVVRNSSNGHVAESQVVQPAQRQSTFSRFASRLPSLQPEERLPAKPLGSTNNFLAHSVFDVSSAARELILDRIAFFDNVVPEDFVLVSRHAISRYLNGYVTGFHKHMPFLHIPTFRFATASIDLVLAVAAVGAFYCREPDKALNIFQVALTIALERVRRSQHRATLSTLSGVHRQHMQPPSANLTPASPTNPVVGDTARQTVSDPGFEAMQTAQALLLLMAMATWSEYRPPATTALAIRSVLNSLVRQDGLHSVDKDDDASWEEWVASEGRKRTKFIVFCFFNIHTIVFDVSPILLGRDISMDLPCSEGEWMANSAASWAEHRSSRTKYLDFSATLKSLYDTKNRTSPIDFSSLGGYVLIHALLQNIWIAREAARNMALDTGCLPSTTVEMTENALKHWQAGWKKDQESSVDPWSPHGPLAFNSTALLRMAYIRINIDVASYRPLDSWDSFKIATAMASSPMTLRSERLTRAALQSAHALSVPVRLGIDFVAHTQMFFWSTQHALCSLECALLLTKWLESVASSTTEAEDLSEQEKMLLEFIMQMLAETEFVVTTDQLFENPRRLSSVVLRVWAKLFRPDTLWEMIDIIGKSLILYADMLER